MQQTQAWQESLARSITDVRELCEILKIRPTTALLDKCSFPLRISREYVSRIKPGDEEDPLLKQILPISAELADEEGYTTDPLAEFSVNPVPGLLHKYQSRVLLTVAGSCAINCRFCFRRHFPYSENNPGTQGWKEAINYIAADSKIDEVIFSGGDPLMLKDQYLSDLAHELNQIPHLKRLRIHTRLPIMIPSRINDDFFRWATQQRLQTVMVLHTNHSREIDEEVSAALGRLRAHQIPLLNQAVLLRGVNDQAQSLIELSQTLFSNGVIPYYLHLLDKVAGTAHFAVSEKRALELIQAMTEQMSGYLVPKLAREVAGEKSKHVIME